MAKITSRYRSTGVEGEWQAGSSEQVLKNLKGIVCRVEADRLEAAALLRAEESYLEIITDQTQFTAKLICQMHADWLGELYEWAGRYRTVELQKGNFRWPPAFRVSQNMVGLEESLLKKYTPFSVSILDDLVDPIARIHAEFLLIHPFREGNGRMARWLADLMFLQAGYPIPLYNFSGEGAKQRKEIYLNAVISGYAQNYKPLADFFKVCVEARLGELED